MIWRDALIRHLSSGEVSETGSIAGNAAGNAQHTQRLEDFWASVRTPIVEEISGSPDERLVTFLWRDAEAEAVLLFVNRITQGLSDGLMERIPNTDVWHRSFRLDADWRGSYLVLPLDTAGLLEISAVEPRWAMRIVRERGLLDSRNPRGCDTHTGRASIAELPAALPLPWVDCEPGERGLTSEHLLSNGRRVWLHRPPRDAAANKVARPLIILLDGEIWHRSGVAARTLDGLHETGEIRTPYLLLVDNEGEPRRMVDLGIDGDMSSEIVHFILPWLRSMVAVSADAADVIVSGESLGGLTSLKTVFDHPKLVGTALAQSPSLWQHDMLDRATNASPIRLYLTAGRHEGKLTDANRALVEQLQTLPHKYQYFEFNGGHDMAWWQGLWAEGVRTLLARSPAIAS